MHKTTISGNAKHRKIRDQFIAQDWVRRNGNEFC
ncbi:hypothetical protein T4B_13786 [Trichinella pseudospiralis]|uniref:Uncharacterized protein n=1 Tax=Trichinella pseudospiralis TaxID=6337 RepID=A0A0V1EKF6_TRIPS|nr:hypothetical protein T4A_2915 [Trichinella pseudospiralis]KRY99747.1 hypothetical protein T4B_13786 [Trichinella pseudospiralis]